MEEGHPVQVAVRLRPIIRPEVDSGGKRIVQLEDSSTVSLSNPHDPGDLRLFTFSHCYWSFDGFTQLQDGHLVSDLKHPNGHKYSDQKRIFDHFGKEIVINTTNGYNSSLISYGESGSGKSWTLFGGIGSGVNKVKIWLESIQARSGQGLIPLFGVELFKSLKDKEKNGLVSGGTLGSGSEVKVTMMEVGDDGRIRDLLLEGSTKYRNVVKLRNHPRRGYYVEGLRSVIISSAEELQQRLDEGQVSRATVSTNLVDNLQSTKSTLVVTLSLVQKYRSNKGDEVTLSSIVDFYDLPPIQQTKAKGPPNGPSLSSASKLIQRALKGNSKTYFIVHLSPSSTCYKESLASLMFGEKMANLITKPLLNEELTSKLVRELKMENESLRKLLSTGGTSRDFAPSDQYQQLIQNKKNRNNYEEELRIKMMEDIKSQMKDNEREIKQLNQSNEDRIKMARMDRPNEKKVDERKSKHLIYNLNPDAQLTARIVHVLQGLVEFGSNLKKDGSIIICGPGIREHHGTFCVSGGKDNKITIKPTAPDCLIRVNGVKVQYETVLLHNDRIVLGGCQIWIVQLPREPPGLKVTFPFAQEELALKSKFYNDLSDLTINSNDLKSLSIKLCPLIYDSNAMSLDLEKGTLVELALIKDVNSLLSKLKQKQDILDPLEGGQSDPEPLEMTLGVKLTQTVSDFEYILEPSTFLERYLKMKSLYIQCQGQSNDNLSDLDPFLEDLDQEVTIGHSLLSLKPLAHLVNFSSNLQILDRITLTPLDFNVKTEILLCNEYFEKVNDSQVYLNSPGDLLGRPLHFSLKLGHFNCPKFRDVYCKYRFNSDRTESITTKLDAKNIKSEFGYERRFSFDKVTQKLVDYLDKDLLLLTFYGKYTKPGKIINGSLKNNFNLGPNLKADLVIAKKQVKRLEQKLNNFDTLINQAESLSEDKISVNYLRRICDSTGEQEAMKVLEEFKEEFKPPEPVEVKSTYQKVSEVCQIT